MVTGLFSSHSQLVGAFSGRIAGSFSITASAPRSWLSCETLTGGDEEVVGDGELPLGLWQPPCAIAIPPATSEE